MYKLQNLIYILSSNAFAEKKPYWFILGPPFVMAWLWIGFPLSGVGFIFSFRPKNAPHLDYGFGQHSDLKFTFALGNCMGLYDCIRYNTKLYHIHYEKRLTKVGVV